MPPTYQYEPFRIHDRAAELANCCQDVFPTGDHSQTEREAFALGFVLGATAAWTAEIVPSESEQGEMRESLEAYRTRNRSG